MVADLPLLPRRTCAVGRRCESRWAQPVADRCLARSPGNAHRHRVPLVGPRPGTSSTEERYREAREGTKLSATVDYTRYDDADLIAFVRAGAVDAFGPLYERHVSAATRRARYLARCSAEADALVSDGFTQVLEALLSGGGPTASFRAYLWRTITNLAYTRSRDEAREVPTEAPPVDDAGRGHVRPESFQDLAIEGVVDRALVVRAFDRLPGTSQEVLWYTEVLNMSPAETAPLLKITPGAVAGRAHRARDDLRTAWLAAHVDSARPAGRCKAIVDELGGWIRETLRTRRRSAVEHHLGVCPSCRKLVAELTTVNATPPAMPARVHEARPA